MIKSLALTNSARFDKFVLSDTLKCKHLFGRCSTHGYRPCYVTKLALHFRPLLPNSILLLKILFKREMILGE